MRFPPKNADVDAKKDDEREKVKDKDTGTAEESIEDSELPNDYNDGPFIFRFILDKKKDNSFHETS